MDNAINIHHKAHGASTCPLDRSSEQRHSLCVQTHRLLIFLTTHELQLKAILWYAEIPFLDPNTHNICISLIGHYIYIYP